MSRQNVSWEGALEDGCETVGRYRLRANQQLSCFANLMIDDVLMDNHDLPMPTIFSYFSKPMTHSLQKVNYGTHTGMGDEAKQQRPALDLIDLYGQLFQLKSDSL